MTLGEFIVQKEVAIRLVFFFGVFTLVALAEVRAPRRRLSVAKGLRWANNIGLVVLNSVLLRLLFPAAAVGFAAFAAQRGWGLFAVLDLPPVLEAVAAVALLDLAIYFQHVLFHAVPAFWRLHRVHHADLDYDVTTGARFHPIEIVLSMLIKLGVIAALGVAPVAVIVFEVLLNATALFNHANLHLPDRVDRVLRRLVVTPDMHRVHHSVEDDETNSNFGFNLPWWDRLFGTYRAQPRAGHQGMTLGIRGFRTPAQCTRLPGLLTLPFRGQVEGYAINRRSWEKADVAP